MKAGSRDRWLAAIGLALIVLSAAALRVPELKRQPIEHDEVYSYLAALGFLEYGQSVFWPTRYPYGRAVVHNALSAGALALGGPSLATARALSVLASLLSIVCLYLICRHWASHLTALGASALLALSTWEGFYAVSARMYSLFQLLFLLVVLTSLRLIENPRRLGSWALLCVAAFGAAGVHRLFLIAAPFVLLGLGWALWRRLPTVRLAGALFTTGGFVVLGMLVESWAPETSLVREDAGTWQIASGNPLRNVGLVFLHFFDERLAVISWLAFLAVPYAIVRPSQGLAFVAGLAFLAGFGTAAGVETQSPHYVLHLFPLFIALGCTALQYLARDAWTGRDTLGDGIRAAVALLDRPRGRFRWVPSAPLLAAAGGAMLIAAGVGADWVFREEFDLGHDQVALIVGGGVLILGAVAWRAWPRVGFWANSVLRLAVLIALLLAIPRWIEWLGPYRYPPFQNEVFSWLRERLEPGDRLLVTEQLIPFLRLPGVPMAYLSQRYDGTRFGSYRSEVDLVTGMPFVDGEEKLSRWMHHPGRTWILTDFRFELHLAPRLRELVARYPTVYRSDPSKLAGRSPHPDWAGNTYEYRVLVANGKGTDGHP